MPTALIAEDEPLLREQLKHRLRDAWPELEVVAAVGTGADALAAFEAHPTDVAFLDIRMPVMSGLDVARAIDPPRDLAALIAKLASRDGGRLKWIRASLGNAMRMIAVDDVLYFQAEDKYTKVVAADGDALIKKPIKDLFDALDPEAFWQVHRGTIVNLRAIARVERDWRDQPVISLKGRDEKLVVSRTFAHRFKAM